MCNQNTLQQKIAKLTNGGEVILRFLTDTVQAKTPGVKTCHQLEAMKYLVRLGNLDDQASTPNRHSRAEPAPSEGRGGNPVGQTEGGINTPSPSTGEGRDGGEKSLSSPPSMSIPTQEDKNTYNYTKTDPDPEQDCYYEPLSPEDQAIFDYQTLIDSGEYKEGEIEIQPPSEAAHQEYAATLKWMRQAATEEGIPLLPNPLSGTLTHPNIRSP